MGPMATQERSRGAVAGAPKAGDIRSARPTIGPVRALGRRVVSIAALVFVDLSGLALALYLALVLRELY